MYGILEYDLSPKLGVESSPLLGGGWVMKQR